MAPEKLTTKENDDVSTYSVDEAFVKTGFGKYQWLFLFYAGMGWVSEAMEMMLLSFVGTAVKNKWNLSSQQESLLSTFVFVGMLVGALTWGIVSDNFGRRTAILFSATVIAVAGLVTTFSPNYTVLVLARAFVGVGAGGGHVVLSWFLEFVPAPNRGKWMVVFSVFWSIGAIFEAGVAWIVMPRLGWRWLTGLSCIPSFIILLFYPWTHESPRYLCSKGRNQKAIKVLQAVARLNGEELPTGVLVTDNQHLPSTDEEGQKSASQKTVSVFRLVIALLSPKLAWTSIVLWFTFFVNAFSYYGLVLLTTELNKKGGACSKSSDSSSKSGDVIYRDVFITTLAEAPGLLIAALIIDKLGRKISTSALLFLTCVFMIPLLFHGSRAVRLISLFGSRAFITGSFAVVYIYTPELYPTVVRSTALGVSSSIGRVGGMVCPQVAVGLVESCHLTAAIVLFVGVIFASALCVLFLPKETKGRKLADGLNSSQSD